MGARFRKLNLLHHDLYLSHHYFPEEAHHAHLRIRLRFMWQ